MKPREELFDTLEGYRASAARMSEAMKARGSGPAALSKRTSNLFRPREQGSVRKLDARSLNRTISVNKDEAWADVEGMTTFEDFSDACLLHGFVPPVVPELKTITVGGAITGIGIESSSCRHGFVHERVLEMDVLCGDGELRTCSPEGEFSDLFHAIPNSYGTLGYVLRARVRLLPAPRAVSLRHQRFQDYATFQAALEEACQEGGMSNFVEGVAFAPDDFVVTTGNFSDAPDPTSSYTGMAPYFTTLRTRSDDLLSVRDYLWRWDPDWFWCSAHFGMQNPLLRRLFGRWMLGSKVYWQILTHYRKWKLEEREHRLRRLLHLPIELSEPVIQDVELPVEHCAEFMDFYWKTINIRPCWVCPVRPLPSKSPWTLYPMETGKLHLNFGFWDSVPTNASLPKDHFNRLLEKEVVRLGGRKSLYSTVHFPEDEFWQIHDRVAYQDLKKRYDPDGRLRDLWQKVVKSR